MDLYLTFPAAKTALQIFLQDKLATQREKEVLKAIKASLYILIATFELIMVYVCDFDHV